MTDIEISDRCNKKYIVDVAKKIGINSDDLILFGKYKAKINCSEGVEQNGKLVLVTAISPTPFGEGKTTVSIGLSDALNRLGYRSTAALREPSMGPVFGMKGGATGGGYSQVIPMDDINLHFTGDMHAITSANNLICAAIDNHIYFGNKLKIKKVLFNRCLDVNDRSLRNISLVDREESFSITSASEIMALFCLATSLSDLKKRLSNIIVGINDDGEYVFVSDLNIEGSLLALLKDAFLPNLVQTLENNPAIIHGGPFANIAHGCSSLVATNLALNFSDYVVTEAGFGADLGAEKFFDIKCRIGNLHPVVVVLVTTIKALKFHGGSSKSEIFKKNDSALINGFSNLDRHYDNLKKFGVNVIVCLNRFDTDNDEEVDLVKEHCDKIGADFSVSTAFKDGSFGALDLANKVLSYTDSKFNMLYDNNCSIIDKINVICKEIYHADSVNINDSVLSKIDLMEKNGFSNLPVCIAKTQYSFSDNKDLVGAPSNFSVDVKDVKLYAGAGFVTVFLGNIMTMPGLSRKPNYEVIDVVDNKIINLN